MLRGGYTGKILRIDLSSQTFSEEDVSERLAKDFIGGAGFGVYYLFKEVPADADPLGEANKLIFAPGPLTGSRAPCASRMAITTKSPLTGAIGMALTGGQFPAELKFAGYDAVIIEGKADKPTWVLIRDGSVSFQSAARLWGTSTFDCQQLIKEDLKDGNVRIACIGPAGEKLSRIACIINERRAAGRKGLGAVMGSKNLKAIAVKGSRRALGVADEEAFKRARRFMLDQMKASPVLYSAFAPNGTPLVVDVTCGMGIFPTKNWSATGEWVPIEGLGTGVHASRIVGKEPCYNCPVGCSRLRLVRDGKYAGALTEGPEYESVYSLGGTVGVDSVDAVIAADRLCDELGFDTMSAGVTVGFAMELFERGIIGQHETDGLELKFGNDEAMMELLHKMAFREGFGAVLADGCKIAAQRIGRGSEQYAMVVKGMELPAYDVRGAKAHGLNYATAYTGADHNRGYAFQEIFAIPVPEAVDRFAVEGKGKLTKWNQDVRAATCDCPTMCAFLLDMALPANAPQNTANLLSAIAGIDVTPEDVVTVGERLNNLARVYNNLAGFTRADDTLPRRLMAEPLAEGNSKGGVISQAELDQMLDEYYAARGWTRDGVPTEEKLINLGLDYAVKALKTGKNA